MKKYIASSIISINVVLPKNVNRHVVFSPMTGNSSVFYTNDGELQKAIEKHRHYGVLFSEDKNYARELERQAQQVNKPEEAEAPKDKVVKVSDADAAKSYLADNFGISRTKLKTIAQIQEAALSCGIEFEGI